jgi:hypothetical protein
LIIKMELDMTMGEERKNKEDEEFAKNLPRCTT